MCRPTVHLCNNTHGDPVPGNQKHGQSTIAGHRHMDTCPICMTDFLPGQHIVSCREATHTVHKHCHDRHRLNTTNGPDESARDADVVTDPDMCVYCRDNQGIQRNRLAERFAEHLGAIATEAMVTSGSLSYTGEWLNNMPHGKGVGTYLNERLGCVPRVHKSVVGGTYDGTWKNGLRSGSGKWKAASGRSFDGEWIEDRPHGKGTMIWPSGDTYVGSFQKGGACGHGCLTRMSGTTYTGQWSNGMYEGKGTRTWPDGSCYTGKWQQGQQNGKGVRKHADGRQEQGVWKNGRLWNGKILTTTHTVTNGNVKCIASHDASPEQSLEQVATPIISNKRHAEELLGTNTHAIANTSTTKSADKSTVTADQNALHIETPASSKRRRVCAAADM